jgi:hypothetical protein
MLVSKKEMVDYLNNYWENYAFTTHNYQNKPMCLQFTCSGKYRITVDYNVVYETDVIDDVIAKYNNMLKTY